MKKIVCMGLTLALACGAAVAAPKGSVKIAGSNTVLPLSQLWAEGFMNQYSGTSVSVAGGGSGQGISSLLNGTCDIANASREAKPKEIQAARDRNTKLVAHKVARDGLSIIVNPSNNVKNLTIKQLGDIYSGKVQTWDQVGGNSKKNIVVVGRDSSSGTYGFIQDALLGGRAYAKDMMNIPTTQQICTIVSQSADAIGYAGMAYAEEFDQRNKVRVVSISRKPGVPGMKPTEANVMDGTYPLFRFLYMYTLGSPSGVKGEFIKYALSADGQKWVTKSGYLPLK